MTRWLSKARAVLVAMALLAGIAFAGSPTPAAAGTLPGNRPNFVFTFMGEAWNASFLRMGSITFRGDGTLDQRYWYWNQQMAPRTTDTTTYRAASGYTSAGCGTTACQVWSAKSFVQTGGTVRTGTWRLLSSGSRLQINFGLNYELYAIANYSTYTELTLVSSNYSGYSRFFGKAYGSKASLSTGATLDQIRAINSPTRNGVRFTQVTANWNTATQTQSNVTQWWDTGNYKRCSGTCMRGANPSYWHSYIVADPAKLGRKMYWFNELASVAKSTICANPSLGGHTVQWMQVIDDNGVFLGMVGGEASIMARYAGGSIVSYYVGFKM